MKLYKGDQTRLVYIDPILLKGFVATINPLEFWSTDIREKELYANHLVDAFEEMLDESSLTTHMKALLKPCIYVLL